LGRGDAVADAFVDAFGGDGLVAGVSGTFYACVDFCWTRRTDFDVCIERRNVGKLGGVDVGRL
jgi:hypothetical protein